MNFQYIILNYLLSDNFGILNKYYFTKCILNFLYIIANQLFDCNFMDYIHYLTKNNKLMIDIVDFDNSNMNIYCQVDIN